MEPWGSPYIKAVKVTAARACIVDHLAASLEFGKCELEDFEFWGRRFLELKVHRKKFVWYFLLLMNFGRASMIDSRRFLGLLMEKGGLTTSSRKRERSLDLSRSMRGCRGPVMN
jgi:hypothetical protein